MADDEGRDEKKGRWNPLLWKPGEPLPWAKFDWAKWLSNPALRRLTPDQRGRFMDIWAATHGTKTPGVMTEEDARLWAGYAPLEWKANREAFARVFNTSRTRGKWRLEDVIETWKASQMVARRNADRARKGAEGAARNRAARMGITPSSTAPSTRQAGLGADQRVDVRRKTGELRAVPDLPSGDLGRSGLAPLASGGTEAGIPALLERALRAGSAEGTGGTDPRPGGAA